MGYPEILFFALKGQQMVEEYNDDDKVYFLSIENAQLMLLTLFKFFQYGCPNIQDGRRRLSCNVIVPENGNGQSERYCFFI